MLLIFLTYCLFSNLKLDGQHIYHVCLYTCKTYHLSSLFQGDMSDGMHKFAERCETNQTYIAAKKAKHLEDSETTPKSCLDAVFKLLETSSQTSSRNSLSESVRLLQSQVLAERHSTTQLRLEVLSLRKIAENTNDNLIAKQLHLEAMTDMLGRSHSLAQQLAQQFPCKANLSLTVLEVVSVQYYFVGVSICTGGDL